MKTRITVFTFGYFGWGNATPQLVKLVDAVERSRGFGKPIFIDIRARRSVRAVGFREGSFGDLLGRKRYLWMKTLGNRHILTRKGPGIQIIDREAAKDLLEAVVKAHERQQRILFFCSCQWPQWEGTTNCHRTTVASLLMQEGRRQSIRLKIVEWPGGQPLQVELDVEPDLFAAVLKGRKKMPIRGKTDLSTIGSLPWGSDLTLHSAGKALHRLVGPAQWHDGGWCLPVLPVRCATEAKQAEYPKEALRLRMRWGLESRSN